MNRKQIIVMWVAILAVVTMCLFPPWRYRHLDTSNLGITNVAGPYRLVFSGPPEVPLIEKDNPGWIVDSFRPANSDYDFKGYPYREWRVEIDTPRIVVSGVILVVVFFGFLITFRDRKSQLGPTECD